MRPGSARSLAAVTLLCVVLALPWNAAHAEPVVDDGAPLTLDSDAEAIDAEAAEEAENAVGQEIDVIDSHRDESAGELGWRRGTKIGVDVLIVRPLRLGACIAGAGFVYPVSVLAAPNSMSAREQVVDVLWTIPYENLTERELGEI